MGGKETKVTSVIMKPFVILDIRRLYCVADFLILPLIIQLFVQKRNVSEFECLLLGVFIASEPSCWKQAKKWIYASTKLFFITVKSPVRYENFIILPGTTIIMNFQITRE